MKKLPIGMAVYQEVFGVEEVNKLRVAGLKPVCLYVNISGMGLYNSLYCLEAGDKLLAKQLTQVSSTGL